MADDLGAAGGEVHAAAKAILSFWFDELADDRHFAKDEALDAEIARRFGGVRDRVLAGGAAGWRGDPETLLAAVIALDQFSRNIHRGSASAFEADALARSLTEEALAKGWDQRLDPRRRVFLYMPFMHAEDADAQQRGVDLFTALGDHEQIYWAKHHQRIISRFGRFPTRNEALGRRTTAEERAWLSQPDADF